ncbi:hypothetical protein [Paraliomyxa miuraensis]|uniref:hypothetical protein n=1 Tax=Paraliomyxa miuraensis TaxID=376150 RepID=UPI00225BD1C4|nr:hypothetical protein [Paraliomyxa miuraensis]MCX4248025.1 hypothetical protein [Paraliomyxa miuraensis]
MLTARTAFAALLLGSTFATGCDVLEADGIGADGGVVVSPDGRMALEIPAGALDESVDITIDIVDGPEGSVSPLYVIEPMGLTFERPVSLVFDYDDESLGDEAPEALAMVAHREADWAYLADHIVDEDDQTVTASLMALSAVTVVLD